MNDVSNLPESHNAEMAGKTLVSFTNTSGQTRDTTLAGLRSDSINMWRGLGCEVTGRDFINNSLLRDVILSGSVSRQALD